MGGVASKLGKCKTLHVGYMQLVGMVVCMVEVNGILVYILHYIILEVSSIVPLSHLTVMGTPMA